VRWPLPLANLRYYGDPVIATKKLDSRSSRVSINQLIQVMVGCLSIPWPDTDHEYHDICRFYTSLWSYVKAHCDQEDYHANGKTWLSHLVIASEAFLSSKDEKRQSIKRLINFGRRRCETFLKSRSRLVSLKLKWFL
jgi:hypothetical protein